MLNKTFGYTHIYSHYIPKIIPSMKIKHPTCLCFAVIAVKINNRYTTTEYIKIHHNQQQEERKKTQKNLTTTTMPTLDNIKFGNKIIIRNLRVFESIYTCFCVYKIKRKSLQQNKKRYSGVQKRKKKRNVCILSCSFE